jgi:hypothetical protein
MAVGAWGGDYFNVIRSWITEANPANWPAEACVDILNMEIQPAGDVLRRLGLTEELTGGALAVTAPTGQAISVHVWKDAGGRAGNDLLLIQRGFDVYAYGNSHPLSAYYVGMVTLPQDVVAVEGSASVISVASINGDAIIAHPRCAPQALSISETGQLSLTRITVAIRVQESISKMPIASRPTGLTHEFEFDLRNAGWPYVAQCSTTPKGEGATRADPVAYTKTKLGVYPALSDLFYTCKTPSATEAVALGTYSPWELEKQESGSGYSVSGKFITEAYALNTGNLMTTAYSPVPPSASTQELYNQLQALFPGNTLVSLGQEGGPITTGTTIRYTNERPSAVAHLNGRVVYAGRDYNGAYCLFFSQLAVDRLAYGKCHQEADPTTEEINDLVDTDGGVIRAPGMGAVLRMVELNSQLVIFSTTGIWAVDGGGAGDGFTGNNFRVTQLSKESCIAPLSIVAMSNAIMFFGETGIHSVAVDSASGASNVENITLTTIQSFYDNIPLGARINAVGAADPTQGRIEWTIVTNDESEYYTLILVLDLRQGGWRKHRVPYGDNRILLPIPPFGTTSSGAGATLISNLVTTTGNRIVTLSGNPIVYQTSQVITDPVDAERRFRYLSSTQLGAGLRITEMATTTFKDWYGIATIPRDAAGYIEFPYIYNSLGPGGTKRAARASAQYVNAFTLRGRLL